MPTRGATINAITLLKEDHKTVRGLLEKLDETTERASESRVKLLARIEQELKIHTTIEEEIFYPAYKAAVSKREDSKLYHEALEEHHVVDMVIAEIKSCGADSEEFSAKAKVLMDLVEHHVEEEEKQMFPRARRVMETSQLQDLGEQMNTRKKEMQSGGSWLPAAGRLIASVAGRVAAAGKEVRSRSRSAAARGDARKGKARTVKARARAKSRPAPKTRTSGRKK